MSNLTKKLTMICAAAALIVSASAGDSYALEPIHPEVPGKFPSAERASQARIAAMLGGKVPYYPMSPHTRRSHSELQSIYNRTRSSRFMRKSSRTSRY